MATQTIERPVQRPAADHEALLPGRYLSVTSFKRDGSAAASVACAASPMAPRRRSPSNRFDPLLDDRSHTPPHGDALLVGGGGD